MARVVDPTRWEKKRHFPAWLGVAAVLVILLVVTAISIGTVWFGEGGTGETRESPDGRYEASAMNLSRGTIGGTRKEWVEIRVMERGSRREVWKVTRQPPPGTAPDYGMRGVKFVEWAADSSAVTVDIGGGQKLTFPVP
jgi:hypothetical protein